MNEELSKRIKSFGWRFGMLLVAALADFVLENIGLFGFGQYTVLVGLVLGEVSKYLNNKISGKV